MSVNKIGKPEAEQMERRAGAKGNVHELPTRRAQNRESVSPGLERVRQVARHKKKEKFTTLLHHLSYQRLWESFYALKRHASPGIDGQGWESYEESLQDNLRRLHRRIHAGGFRASPVLRQYIAKQDGSRRPLGVTALEDKIVQRAVVDILQAIYEEDFLGFSYGFRPRRRQHDALDALSTAIETSPVNWILDADLKSFFDTVDHEWLMRFVEHRVADGRILRLIRNWLTAGVVEDGRLLANDSGTPQGAVLSPLLANIYLHYVFDLWAQQWRQRTALGRVVIVRYADDIVVGFAREIDARRFLVDVKQRFSAFALQLNDEKTRLLQFGRHARVRCRREGRTKPETFTFLGFVFISGQSRRGVFQLQRHSRADRMRNTLRDIKDRLRRMLHAPIPEQGAWLKVVVQGYLNYHAVPTNIRALSAFVHHVTVLWMRTLKRRSQKSRLTWDRMNNIARVWLPTPRILHPWPNVRFAVTHPRREPSA
jgi:group II intron reverse transcriptase/maturase